MSVPLLIFPYNGNGLEAIGCLGSEFCLSAFVDDTPEKWGLDKYGYPVFGRDAFKRFANSKVLAVPGSPASYLRRKRIVKGLELPEARFATVVHPTASISPLAQIGQNVLIMAGVVITSNAVIGSHVCILPNTVIHHDVVINEWALIGSNVTLAGGCLIGENAYIGSRSSVMNGVSIGHQALVGIGSNVIRDVLPASTVVGNPARILRGQLSSEIANSA